MDRLDWEHDKGTVIFTGLVWVAAVGALLVGAGYLLHLGWTLYQP